MRWTAGEEGRDDLPPWANLSTRQQLTSAVLFAVAYVLAARLAKDFALSNGVSAWYPPAAVMFAYLLIAGPRYVAVAAGVRVVSDLINFGSVVERDGLATVVAGAVVVAGVYAWGAWVLRHNRLDHARLRQFGWFAMVGVVACPLLAAAGFALVQVVFADASADQAYDQASTFWIGDAVAIASIVPFVLLLAYALQHGRRETPNPVGVTGRIEIVAQAAAVVVVPVGIFAARGSEQVAPFLFLAMIPVIWVALRQNLLVASFGVLVTNTVVALGARSRLGVTDDFVAVQTLMLAAALAALYVGAVRRTENQQLAETVESETRYRTLIENSPTLVARFDPAGELLLHAGRLDPDRPDDEVVRDLAGRGPDLAAAATDGAVADVDWSIEAGAETRWLETRAVAERSIDGDVTSVLTVTSDRTSIRRATDALAAMARRDALTGLPNRAAVDELLDAPPDDREPTDPDPLPAAVVAVLLDGAEAVMAGLGRRAADAVAVAMADRLAGDLDEGEVLARIGPTSFAVIARGPDRAGAVADTSVTAMGEPFEIDHEVTYLRVSAGVCAADDDGAPPRLEHAELAARFARDAGGSRVARFAPSMTTAAAETRSVIHGLRHGLDHDELVVHYQPIVSLVDGRALGAEALVRWQRPGHGLIGPAAFVEIAERSGLIDDIGAAVERIASRELLPRRGELPQPAFALNLNVSSHQLTNRTFPDRIGAAIDRFAEAGIGLHLELTETAIMADPATACAVLADLREQGATIVLDDFGTGFSAISWLHQLPVDAIKLDRSFVSGLPDDEASSRIARLITALANELGLALTAEGVETEGQRTALVGLGCTQAQGYLFGRPTPLAELLAALAGPPLGAAALPATP